MRPALPRLVNLNILSALMLVGVMHVNEVTATPQPELDPRAHLGERTLKATRRDGAINIDGRLDESAWRKGVESVGFTERKPNPGATPPVESAVTILYDDDALYIGARFSYNPDEPPVAWELRRDNGSLWRDDAVTIKIDPRRDKRTTLGFALNVAGAMLDLIALDNGSSFLTEYDMIWEGATSQDDSAWYAEVRIPYATLAFEAGDETPEPGIAISRDHPARQATDDWTLLPPEFGPASAMHYGTVKGLSGVRGGRPLVLMPYLSLSGLDAPRPVGGVGLSSLASARVGGEARLNLSEGAWAELSVLTDFAQVDLDDALLNLTRFPLFYPERRPFFLNGTDVFTFGASGSSQLFFSRRIGLTGSGEELPIYGGAKIYNRSGKMRYGVLSTLSGLSPTGEDAGLESANIGRARVELNDGYIGLIMTHLERVDPLDPNLREWESGFGIDVNQRFLKQRLEISGSYSGLLNADVTEGEGATPQSANARARWRGADYQSSLSYLYVDELYNPELGFVRRGDVSSFNADFTRVFYKPLNLNRISLGVVASGEWSSTFERDLDRTIAGSLLVISREGWVLDSMFGYLDKAVIREDFELAGVRIAPGRYRGPSGYISVGSPSAGARLSASLTYMYDGAFYHGESHTLMPTLNVSASRHLRFTTSYNYSRLNFEQAERVRTSEHAINGGLTITPNTAAQLDMIAQLNTQLSQRMGLARLRWRWAPGSDLFLVYRLRDTYERDGVTLSDADAADHQVMFKVVWRSDLLYR